MMKFSERYQKALVTVAMNLRTEEDIRKNGLYRFSLEQKNELITCLNKLFKANKNLLVLKIKNTGFRSEHLLIGSRNDLDEFIKHLDTTFLNYVEIWVLINSVISCWRCRIYLNTENHLSDTIEMAKSENDHILDNIQNDTNVPHVLFERNKHSKEITCKLSNLDKVTQDECLKIAKDIFAKYSYEFNNIINDMELLKISGISLDCRVNNGYDFHDFDTSYDEIKKVIDFYVPAYILKHYKN